VTEAARSSRGTPDLAIDRSSGSFSVIEYDPSVIERRRREKNVTKGASRSLSIGLSRARPARARGKVFNMNVINGHSYI
jgi:hypothetical protein